MRTFYIGILTIVLVSMVSCSKTVATEVSQRKPIEFDVDYNVALKGITLTDANIQSNTMGVVAAVAMADGDQAGEFLSADADLQELMDAVPVRYLDEAWRTAKYENKKWVADPYYWPVNPLNTVSFFAYVPYGENNAVKAHGDWDNRKVTIDYTPESNPLNQYDLCIADPVLDRPGYDPVALSFSHTLSWVTFAANYEGNLPPDAFLRIDELSLYNLYGSNSLTIYPQPLNSDPDNPIYFSWDAFDQDDSKDARYDLSVGKTTLGEVRIDPKTDGENQYKDFVTNAGILYVLPQTVNASDMTERTKIDVVFSFVKKDAQNNNTTMAQFQTSYTLPDGVITFAPATKYRLGFTLNVDTASMVDFQCVEEGKWIIDWIDSGNNHTDTTIR